MKKDIVIYFVLLVAALVLQYTVELYWSATFALNTRTLVPWLIDAISYGVLGGIGCIVLRTRSLSLRIFLLALIAVLPHVLFEMTHGSDPAYPYIGLLFIVPDLIWISIGAGFAAVLASRMSASNIQPK